MTQLLQPMPGPGASIEPLETAGLAMRGAISDIAGGRVQGWFSCLPGSRLPRVVALIDGDIKGFGELTRLPPPTAELDEFAQTFAILLGSFYFIVDVLGWRRGLAPFLWVGSNPIALYLGSGFGFFRTISERLVTTPPPPYDWLPAAMTFTLMLATARWLHQRQLFLRV